MLRPACTGPWAAPEHRTIVSVKIRNHCSVLTIRYPIRKDDITIIVIPPPCTIWREAFTVHTNTLGRGSSICTVPPDPHDSCSGSSSTSKARHTTPKQSIGTVLRDCCRSCERKMQRKEIAVPDCYHHSDDTWPEESLPYGRINQRHSARKIWAQYYNFVYIGEHRLGQNQPSSRSMQIRQMISNKSRRILREYEIWQRVERTIETNTAWFYM